jgi:hypothetical protein
MHERTTRNIRKPGDVGNLNFSTFTQIRNGLISWSFEIPASAYCHRKRQAQAMSYLIKINKYFILVFLTRNVKRETRNSNEGIKSSIQKDLFRSQVLGFRY